MDLNPVPKTEDSLNPKKMDIQNGEESKDFPPQVKSIHSYKLVDSRSQTLVCIKPIFEALVGESVAWKVERGKEFLNIAQ